DADGRRAFAPVGNPGLRGRAPTHRATPVNRPGYRRARPGEQVAIVRAVEDPEGTELMAGFDYDVLIIGSGFGGSVAALRAAEKGYRVGVLESGRRWKDEDIPKSQWHLPGFL